MTKTCKSSSFTRLVTIASFTKLADILISTKTTLPWILTSIGAPPWVISLLVPVREAGSLIPQWTVQLHTRHIRDRVALWRTGSLIQAISIMLMAPVIFYLSPDMAAWSILLLLVVLSLGRAVCSLSMKDIQGALVNKGNRGKLVGMATSVSSALSLLTVGFLLLGSDNIANSTLVLMVVMAGALFLLTLPLSMPLNAQFSAKGDDPAFPSFIQVLCANQALMHLVISRCLLLHSALVAPFFVSLSFSREGVFQLPFFIIASSVASVCSSYLWGHIADKSAVKCLKVATMACILAVLAFYFLRPFSLFYVDVGLFFVLSTGYAGVRIGRKTYLLDIAEDKQRALYVATANSAVGYILLILGAIYALAYQYIGQHIMLLMSALLVAGFIHTFWLKAEK